MAYTATIRKLNDARRRILEIRAEMRELQADIEPEPVNDYEFATTDGPVTPTRASSAASSPAYRCSAGTATGSSGCPTRASDRTMTSAASGTFTTCSRKAPAGGHRNINIYKNQSLMPYTI